MGMIIVSNKEMTDIILKLRNISVLRSGVQVLDNISIEVNKGDFVGLVGPNGGGKTSLLLTILGELKPLKGDVIVYGHEPACRHNSGMVGWVPQAASNLSGNVHISVRELINLGTLSKNNFLRRMDDNSRDKVDQAIKMVGLIGMEDVDISRLSGGQLQRAVIGKALASESDFLLLDEPLVGVDRSSKNSLLKLLDDLCHHHGKTIIMVSHDLTAVKKSTHRIIYLEKSIQFDGPSKELPDLNDLAKIRGIVDPHSTHIHTHTTKLKTGDV